jgi:hypothetical protein
MTELEKFEKIKELGYTYDRYTGKVQNRHGREMKSIKLGWVYFAPTIGKKTYQTYAHRFGFWWVTGLVPTHIDHINRIRHDNRFENIRASDYILNSQNRNTYKGYLKTVDINDNDLFMIITIINGKFKVLGKFKSEEEVIEFRKYLKEHKNELIKNG